jgi:hypothetical protein
MAGFSNDVPEALVGFPAKAVKHVADFQQHRFVVRDFPDMFVINGQATGEVIAHDRSGSSPSFAISWPTSWRHFR